VAPTTNALHSEEIVSSWWHVVKVVLQTLAPPLGSLYTYPGHCRPRGECKGPQSCGETNRPRR
jgi:hypothetical protein